MKSDLFLSWRFDEAFLTIFIVIILVVVIVNIFYQQRETLDFLYFLLVFHRTINNLLVNEKRCVPYNI